VSSKPSSSFLAFACVGEVDGDVDFAAGASGKGGDGSAISVAKREPPGTEGAPGKDGRQQ